MNNGRCVLMLFFLSQLLFLRSFLFGQQPQRPNQLLVEHNSRILIKEKDKPGVHLISIVADQVLFSSRAYIHIWKFNNVDEIARYLALQDSAGIVAPKEIELSRCRFFTVDTAGKFAVNARTYQWYGGNVKASWLTLDDSDRVEVLDFKQMNRDFRPLHEEFEPWNEFVKRHNPKVYNDSWTELDL